MKKLILVCLFALLSSAILSFYGCKKSSGTKVSPTTTDNKWTFNGTTYGTICVAEIDSFGCGGLSVGIMDTAVNTYSNLFAINNFPAANSGTFQFTDGYVGDSTCTLYAYNVYANGAEYYSKSGTLTKTGAKTFTFSCIVYDPYTNASYPVTGKGIYQ